MSFYRKLINTALILAVALSLPAFSQNCDGDHDGWDDDYDNGYRDCDGRMSPDSLETITVSGTAIVVSNPMHSIYFLDEDGDGVEDYRLNFGPYWYTPDSSNAQRPQDGDAITISGGSHDAYMDSISVIVVTEINGLFWRDLVAPTWNYMGRHNGDRDRHNRMGFAFGWMHDSLRTIELSGNVLTDTTMNFTQYYLDADEDNQPDYFLNFGPPWYVPSSGAERPVDGDAVTVMGGMMDNHSMPTVMVYELNGQTWRDSVSFGMHLGGGWINKDMDHGRYFHTMFDSLDGMHVNPGWHGNGGHGHNMMDDSLFCQILEVFPQNIPNGDDQHIMSGYEVGMFNAEGQNRMWNDNMNGGHMNFNSQVDFTFHYSDIQLMGENMDEKSLQAKYWDNQANDWVVVEDAVIDNSANTVTFSSNEVSNFVILTGTESVTAIDDNKELYLKGFALKQNYPNPFNPETNIEFELQENGFVSLSIYNVLGQKVVTLLNEAMNKGVHSVKFQANNFPSGIYYYSLESNGQQTVRKMTLMK
jgi:Secretion system C-terminal sorting domain